jgi:hypothetical protein
MSVVRNPYTLLDNFFTLAVARAAPKADDMLGTRIAAAFLMSRGPAVLKKPKHSGKSKVLSTE